jgi:hypothetical protein
MPTPRSVVTLGPDAESRFWSRVDKGDGTGCWLWTGGKNPVSGYGQFWTRGKPLIVRAHRVALLFAHIAMPDDLEVDHLCRVRLCVRPDHLELVPHRINVLRGTAPTAAQARRTHCKNGHEFTPETTYTPPSRPYSRICKLCPNYLNRNARSEASRRRRALERHLPNTGKRAPVTQRLPGRGDPTFPAPSPRWDAAL